GARRRRLVNEEALITALAAHDIVAVTLEEMTFVEQVRLFAEAELIVALHGAGLANLVFSDAVHVVEIGSRAWPNPCFKNICESLRLRAGNRRDGNLRYAHVPGEPVGSRRGYAADVRVDID